MVRIRLSRYGRKKLSSYRIVVISSKKPRNGKYIEKIGFFNPSINTNNIKNKLYINIDRIYFWKKKGASLSKRIPNLIKMYERSI
ncbi:30S ribosomal protein S16 [endosymbiont of Sipalinus gigas]|uniref:30S ribosomal protein S16 n=1 Tax=endosymbiont of Sipalinus gigas TaxID=1972134 RepID=UPI000DC70799|nr:30S ribosomal protein S16 [endosymbiont of Sipalinus gigas]BBA85218.1 30S ribosomal protein S16 [endosymbiont of Sipalinus gigas]